MRKPNQAAIDMAILTVHEFVGDSLGGDTTLERCVKWCLRSKPLPEHVAQAIGVLEAAELI